MALLLDPIPATLLEQVFTCKSANMHAGIHVLCTSLSSVATMCYHQVSMFSVGINNMIWVLYCTQSTKSVVTVMDTICY